MGKELQVKHYTSSYHQWCLTVFCAYSSPARVLTFSLLSWHLSGVTVSNPCVSSQRQSQFCILMKLLHRRRVLRFTKLFLRRQLYETLALSCLLSLSHMPPWQILPVSWSLITTEIKVKCTHCTQSDFSKGRNVVFTFLPCRFDMAVLKEDTGTGSRNNSQCDQN